jgi:hypothetical protein
MSRRCSSKASSNFERVRGESLRACSPLNAVRCGELQRKLLNAEARAMWDS